MIGSILNLVPWTHQGPGWSTVAVLVALTGAALSSLLKTKPRFGFVAGVAAWIVLATILILAMRGGLKDETVSLTALRGARTAIVICTCFSIAGIFAWLLASAATVSQSGRRSLGPLIFLAVASAIGGTTAGDLLVMLIWQLALGGSVIGLVLLMQRRESPANAGAILIIEGIFLLGAALALATLGTAPKFAAAPSALLSFGLVALVVALVSKAVAFALALPLVARSDQPVLAAEVAIASIAIPSVLCSVIGIVERVGPAVPGGLKVGLGVFSALLLLLGAIAAIGARDRGRRIAAIAVSLVGLSLLGVCEGARTALLFVLLWVGPVPAFLAASSIAGRIDRGGMRVAPQALTPQADAIGLLLAAASLAVIGLPPFSGFWPRFALLQSAWSQGDYTIVGATLLSSLVLAFALSRRAFERTPATVSAHWNRPANIALPELLVLGAMSGLSLAGGLYPAPFDISSNTAVEQSRPTLYSELERER